MGELLVELLLRPLFEIIIHVLGYALGYLVYGQGYLVVTILSLGLLTPAPLSQSADSEFRKSLKIPWWHVTYRKNGQRYMLAEMVVLVGILSSVAIGVLIFWILVSS